MNKKQCIINYVKKQIPVSLDYNVIKTDKDFQRNYRMHDAACKYIVKNYEGNGYTIHQIGADQRERKVIIQNELPNYFAEKGEEIFCFDAKAKKYVSTFGWVNERAAISYINLARTCEVPLYLNFTEVRELKEREFKATGEVGHCNIMDEPITKKHLAKNGNIVWKYRWKEGLYLV